MILEFNEAAGQGVADAIGDRAGFIQTDISDHKSVEGAFGQIEQQFGRLDVLYNNASIFLGDSDRTVCDLSVDVWHKILSVNLHGLFYCCKFGIPLMIKSGGGAVINTASSAAILGIPRCDAYTASKGATVTLTRSMAVEFGPHNVRVNCIAPAAIDTPMLRQSSRDNPHFDEQGFFKMAPLGRYGTTEEIAKIALFLASDESSYLNGTIIAADGGITITSFSGGTVRTENGRSASDELQSPLDKQ